MAVLYTNNAGSTLASGISNSATSLTVATGDGSKFPSLSGGDVFYATLAKQDDSVLEVVKVTARSANTFTVARAQDGTTAAAWSAGDLVELRITRALLDGKQAQDDDLDAIAALTDPDGLLRKTGGGWGLDTRTFARETQFATYADVDAQPKDYWLDTDTSSAKTNFWTHSVLYNDPAGFNRFVETYQSLPVTNKLIPDFNQPYVAGTQPFQPANASTVDFDYIVDCGDSIL